MISLGSFRLPTAQATPGQRAGLVAAIYIAGYLAFSIPALIAGVTTTKYGLHSTALVYAASVAVLAAAAAGLMWFRPAAKLSPPALDSPAVTPSGAQAVNPPDEVQAATAESAD
jgi:hypothetical protein